MQHRHIDKAISRGLHRKLERRGVPPEQWTEYFENWYDLYGKAKRKKLDILWERQNGNCFFCGIHTWRFEQSEENLPYAQRATLEHKRCKGFGGTDTLRNLVMSCHRCNQQRGQIPFARFLRAKRTGTDVRTRKEKQRAIIKRKKPKDNTKKLERQAIATWNLAVYLFLTGYQS